MGAKATWRRSWSAAGLALGAVTSTVAAGAEPWLTASGSPRCAVRAEVLATQVASAVVGQLDPELRAAVVLRDSARGTRATVSLSRRGRSLGQRRLTAARCDDVLDAVVAVTALASSSMAGGPALPPSGEDDDVTPRPEPSPADVPRPEQPPAILVAVARSEREPALPVDRGPSEAVRPSSSASLLLGTGADLLALGGAASLSAGAALRSGAGTWRAQLRYGLPTLADDEETLPLRSVKSRSERGAVAFDYCRDVDGPGWFAACAGLELGVARNSRTETLDAEAGRERRWLDPQLAAVVGSSFSYRALRWQPGVELSMLLPALGGAGGRRVGLRAQAGVAVPF